MTDMSWDVLPKTILLNHNERTKPIGNLLHNSHEDFDRAASDFLFNQSHVEETRDRLHEMFDMLREDVHHTGSANVIQGPTFAMAIYLELFNKYSDRFITGEVYFIFIIITFDEVVGLGEPRFFLYLGILFYK